jgi:hypothetical protein
MKKDYGNYFRVKSGLVKKIFAIFEIEIFCIHRNFRHASLIHGFFEWNERLKIIAISESSESNCEQREIISNVLDTLAKSSLYFCLFMTSLSICVCSILHVCSHFQMALIPQKSPVRTFSRY